MKSAADYLIVQHVADLFRREPRNVGVFVRFGDEVDARFFGEDIPGQPIDRRRIRALPYPSVYAQWVRYWRRAVNKGGNTLWEDLQKSATDHYRVVDGGIMEGLGHDTVQDAANFLYAALVSEGGIAAAIGGPDEIEETIKLAQAVERTFDESQLLDDEGTAAPAVRHPVRRNVEISVNVQGNATTTYQPAFVQKSEKLVIMEPVDIAVKRDRKRVRERAAFTSVMFGDLRDGYPESETVSIINATAAEEREPNAMDALRLLRRSSRVVNWQSQQERERLISELSTLAVAG